MTMNEFEQPKQRSARAALARDSLVFQLKLIADGFRDFLLVPIALVATLAGLLRSGKDPELEFERVLALGRQSEKWINLFGQHQPVTQAGATGSMDNLVTRAEEVLREQVRKGNVSDSAGSALERALSGVHAKVKEISKNP